MIKLGFKIVKIDFILERWVFRLKLLFFKYLKEKKLMKILFI